MWLSNSRIATAAFGLLAISPSKTTGVLAPAIKLAALYSAASLARPNSRSAPGQNRAALRGTRHNVHREADKGRSGTPGLRGTKCSREHFRRRRR